MVKFALYFLSAIVVIWALDGININAIFKKNKVYQARVFYLIIAFVLIYLLTNFLYDFIYLKLF